MTWKNRQRAWRPRERARGAAALRGVDVIERSEQSGPVELGEDPADLAYRALLDHATTCGRCAANWRECPTRRALSETLRQVR